MRWKWYTLRVSSLLSAGLSVLLGVFALIVTLVSSGFSLSMTSWVSVAFLILFTIANLVFLIVQWQATGALLSHEMQDFPRASRKSGRGLVVGTVLLFLWLLVTIGSFLEAFGNNELYNSRPVPGLQMVAILTGIFLLVFVVAFLFAIAAYFELKHRRRLAEDELVIGIGIRP